ncbi:ALK tyrosine kinase receptor-like isoform X8 [Apostichopus japonicus]|uniref:ALK tyrosine kinase receptor-like isoform X8 n=1 Tax=Stichopus japonicus TaxID=307972 RepID=UPI003AB143B0
MSIVSYKRFRRVHSACNTVNVMTRLRSILFALLSLSFVFCDDQEQATCICDELVYSQSFPTSVCNARSCDHVCLVCPVYTENNVEWFNSETNIAHGAIYLGERVGESVNSCHETNASLTVKPCDDENESSIRCQQGEKVLAKFTLICEIDDNHPNFTLTMYIITVGVTISIAVGCGLTFALLFSLRKLTQNRRGHQMNVLDKGASDTDQSINRKSILTEGTKALPKIPDDEENSQNSHNSGGSEPNYYSTADVIAGKDPRLLSENEISIIKKIKIGKIYKRWMGSINLANETNKCVVITTLTEKLIRKKEIHWEAYIRKCLELPASNHLAKIEAISIQNNRLWLITTHFAGENLHSVLSRDTKEKGDYYCCSSMSVTDVIKHISGILEGMDILKTFGFLHPGLSSKKVLLTKEGHVKLYDFCLSSDARKLAILKKEQIRLVSLNQFPPELLLLNEYTESSDVWSTAVVIWEIMSAGTPPFPVDMEVESIDNVAAPSVPWPERYMQIKDEILFDCWNHNCSLRPSIHHLRETFVAKFEKLIGDSSYEIPIPTTYVPMGAANTDQATYAEHIYHAGN